MPFKTKNFKAVENSNQTLSTTRENLKMARFAAKGPSPGLRTGTHSSFLASVKIKLLDRVSWMLNKGTK